MTSQFQPDRRTDRLTVAVILAAALYAAGVPLKLDSDVFMLLQRPLWLACSDFAVNDWYCSLKGYDWAYTYVVSLLAWVCPSKQALLVVLHVLYAGLHFVMALVVYGVFRKGRGGFAAWLFLLVLFRALCDRPYYSYHFMPGYATPASVAAVFMLMALACLLQGHWGRGVILLAVASAFHLNTFLLSCLLLGGLVPYWLIRHQVSWRLLAAGAVFVVLAVPSVWTIVASMQAPVAVRQEADWIIANVRAPHHYRTSEFPVLYAYAAWAPLVPCVLTVVYSLLRQGRRALGGAHYLLGVVGVVVLLNALLTLVLDVPAVGRLNLVRLLPFAYFVGLCILAGDLVRHLRERRWDHLVLVVMVAWLVRRGLPKEMLWTGGLVILMAILLLAVRGARAGHLREAVVAVIIGVKVFSPIGNVRGIVADAARGTLVDTRAPGAHRAVYDWLRDHTPVGAVLVVDPALDEVRFFSERAVVANFKCAPYAPADVVEWYRRIEELTHKGIEDIWRSSDYAAKSLNDLRSAAARYGASCIVVPSGSRAADPDRPAAYRDGEFVVFDVAELNRKAAEATSTGRAASEPFDISLRVHLGEDRGQSLGSLFSLRDGNGDIVSGAGFVEAYSTHIRDNNRILSFYFKRPGGTTRIVAVGKPFPDRASARLYFDGDDLLALGSDVRRYSGGTWTALDDQSMGSPTGFQSVGPVQLKYGIHRVLADDRTLLRSDTCCLYPYLSDGKLYVVEWQQEPTQMRLLTYPWPSDKAQPFSGEPEAALLLPIRRQSTGPAMGNFRGEFLLGTYDGDIHRVTERGIENIASREMRGHAQVYSMIHYRERLVIGTCPSGRLYEYDGTHVKPFEPPLPKLDKAHPVNREAQTLSIYCGDLYVGCWPWGDLWRFDGRKWTFVARMFSAPPVAEINPQTGAHNTPYASEYFTRGVRRPFDTNQWGQRIVSLTNAWDSLFVATAHYGGRQTPSEEEKAFITDEVYRQYGQVHRLTRDYQVSCRLEWKRDCILRFAVTRDAMTVEQDGKIVARKEFDAPLDYPSQKVKIEIGRGVFGPAGARIERVD